MKNINCSSCDSVEIIADSAAAAAKGTNAEKSTEVKEGDKDGDGEDESGQEQKEEEQVNVSGRVKNREKSQITRIQNLIMRGFDMKNQNSLFFVHIEVDSSTFI